jgi:hypothetical protein
VIALASTTRTSAPAGDFDDCQSKFDRAGMLRSIERLAAAVGQPQPLLAEVS